MQTKVLINVNNTEATRFLDLESSNATLYQADNESLDAFIARVKVTIEIHQGAMRDTNK